MDDNQLIRNWHARAADEDYFSKFIFEYLAFIAILKKKKFPNAAKDRQAIQFLKQDTQIRDMYFLEIDNNTNYKNSWNLIISELKTIRLGNVSNNITEVEEIKYWNCPHSELNQQTDVEKSQVKGEIHSLEDWGNMVEFWYSIRSNLFHGGKDPQSSRDQFLVEHGYKTLRPLIEILIEKENF